MANILSTSQLIQRFLDFYKTSQPNMSTTPGSVVRNLFIDSPSIRLAELYNELLSVSSSQSLSRSVGQDVENLASNYSITKLQPGKASGPALLTFNSLPTDIVISGGSLIYSRNGLAFRATSGIVISAASETQYRALATSYRSDLDFVNITDNYAIEVIIECTTTGTQGNISKYSLVSTAIPGISGVTNVVPFTGGSSGENDSAFKNRVMAIFSGSNTGTELGYQNLVLANSTVLDAIVIGPGDPLMTRDGTLLETDSNGDLVLDSNNQPIIISEGTGGKVDIYVYGRRLLETIDSYIYNDKSGKSDPTQEINDFSLGQIAGDENKTITRKRKENIASGTLPNQPVLNLLEVIGSRSGSFSQQIIDEFGNFTGNYTLLKDTGTYSNSCWGFDKLHWVRNYISTLEDTSKNIFNGQDSLLYSDATEITEITRTVSITNENSTIDPLDRSTLTLSHTPIRGVNRVLNVTTGERYVVENRNVDGAVGDLNTTGRIKISGKSLPAMSNTLQVDYEWDYTYDPFIDFDSFTVKDNPRTAIDVVDWGYSNAIRREESFIDSGYQITVTHNVSSVISANTVVTEVKTVDYSVQDQNYIISGLTNTVTNVVSVKRADGAELYNTNKKDGTFDNNIIILPTDTSAVVGDVVTVVYNAFDLFTINGISGSFSGNIIYLNEDLVTNASPSTSLFDSVEVNYIADVNELLPSSNLTSLPASKYQNGFILTGAVTGTGVQPTTNKYSGTTIIQNLRKSPCKLITTLSGITSPGVIRFTGRTIYLIKDLVINCTDTGLTQNLYLSIKKALNIDSNTSLSSYIKVVRLVSLEKVETINDVVTNVLVDYDIVGYSIKDNSLVMDNTVQDSSLSNTSITLPATATNLAEFPVIGDKLRVTFYIATDSDIEDVSFSTNGTLYTNKTYINVSRVEVSSGFKTLSVLSGAIAISSMNQPLSGTRYRTRYNYIAPKNGERITIRYNQNALISDLTLSIEDQRPITADVIVKSSGSILIDVTIQLKVLTEYEKTKEIVKQNVADKISSYINNLGLGKTLNPSDLVPVAYQVSGVDSIIITRFNKSDIVGNASQIVALGNQYMQANNITVNFK